MSQRGRGEEERKRGRKKEIVGGGKRMERSGWMGNQKRTGRWEIRNAKNAGIKKRKRRR